MKRSKNTIFLFSVIIFSLLFMGIIMDSCSNESKILDELEDVCFDTQILPIFLNSCALSGCHDQITAEKGLVYNSYENILKSVSPGDPNSSEAYKSLINVWSDELMPPGEPLSLENRTLIRVWIEQGAINTICIDTTTNPGDTSSIPGDTAIWVNPRACFERDIFPIIKSSCAISGCHNNITIAGETNLSDFLNIRENLIPGDPEESEIYQKLIESNPNDRMPPPPGNPLPQEQKDSIYNWILYGALDEYCGVYCDTISEITFSDFIWPIINLNCLSCHSGANPSGGVYLTNYSELVSAISAGRLPGVLNGEGYPLMPPETGLADCQIRQMEIWIENGFQNN